MKREPEPPVGDPPRDLPEDAAAKWREVAGPEVWGGRLTVAHREVLAGYCRAWARLRAYEGKIGEDGEMVAGPNGFPQVHPLRGPAASLEKELHRQAMALAALPVKRR